MNICTKCKNVLIKGRKEYIFSYYCKNAPAELTTHPITGKVGYLKLNENGFFYVSDVPYVPCRKINMCGDCEDYILEEGK